VSNKTWRFSDNELLVRTIRLNLAAETPTFELSIYSDKPGGGNTGLSEPIGLDGRSRGKLADYAFVANKGSWVDGRTFCPRTPLPGEWRNSLLDA
jgi:hypothetical protein